MNEEGRESFAVVDGRPTSPRPRLLDGLQEFRFLACAIAGKSVEVCAGSPGSPPWTDGRNIFIDEQLQDADKLEAIAAQSALISAGSLDREIVRELVGRRARAKRYLAIEGERALRNARHLLPPLLSSRTCGPTLVGSYSPKMSLLLATTSRPVPESPIDLGVLQPRAILAVAKHADLQANAVAGTKGTAARDMVVSEEEESSDPHHGNVSSIFPVGNGTMLGRLIQRLLRATSSRSTGIGQPGGDTPLYETRTLRRAGRNVLRLNLSAPSAQQVGFARGSRYPEWDWMRAAYREDWCTVNELEAEASAILEQNQGLSLRKPLSRVAMGLSHIHRQPRGDDIDFDAAVEGRINVLAGQSPDESFYLANVRRRRDVSILLLLDVSGSANSPGTGQVSVHKHQCEAATALMEAFDALGDRVAAYAYQSLGRGDVRMPCIKRFDEGFGPRTLQRLHGLRPAAYSRLGAAIRHGATVLETAGGTARRIMIVLSDGLAYDHGYERQYGREDVRHALSEARARGTGCMCLSIGASTTAEDLRQVFGEAAHASLTRARDLAPVIGSLMRVAMHCSEAKRRL